MANQKHQKYGFDENYRIILMKKCSVWLIAVYLSSALFTTNYHPNQYDHFEPHKNTVIFPFHKSKTIKTVFRCPIFLAI